MLTYMKLNEQVWRNCNCVHLAISGNKITMRTERIDYSSSISEDFLTPIRYSRPLISSEFVPPAALMRLTGTLMIEYTKMGISKASTSEYSSLWKTPEFIGMYII